MDTLSGIRAVTFDVTGTLLHAPRIGEIYAEVLGRHGLEASAGEIGRLVPIVLAELDCRTDGSRDRFSTHPDGARGWWRRFAERLAEYLELPAPSRFATAELYDRFARADAWEIYPDATAALDRLAAEGDLRLGVIANWDERLPRLLDDLGLANRFQSIVYAADVGFEKPDPRIFTAALEELGTAPEETLHVGDRKRQDVEGALAVGMGALLVVRRPRGALPAGAIPSLDQLPALLV